MTKNEIREYYRDTAWTMATHSTLVEIALRLGISEEQFQMQFQRKVNHYMMKCLQTIEDIDPNHAASLQILSEDDLQADLELPLIFQ